MYSVKMPPKRKNISKEFIDDSDDPEDTGVSTKLSSPVYPSQPHHCMVDLQLVNCVCQDAYTKTRRQFNFGLFFLIGENKESSSPSHYYNSCQQCQWWRGRHDTSELLCLLQRW